MMSAEIIIPAVVLTALALYVVCVAVAARLGWGCPDAPRPAPGATVVTLEFDTNDWAAVRHYVDEQYDAAAVLSPADPGHGREELTGAIVADAVRDLNVYRQMMLPDVTEELMREIHLAVAPYPQVEWSYRFDANGRFCLYGLRPGFTTKCAVGYAPPVPVSNGLRLPVTEAVNRLRGELGVPDAAGGDYRDAAGTYHATKE